MKFYELITGIETLAARQNLFNVSLCLGEAEGAFASDIDQRPFPLDASAKDETKR